MKFYFAATQKMLDQQNNENYHLSSGNGKFGESFLASVLGMTAGVIVNYMLEFQIDKPYVICQAEAKDADLLEGLRAAMARDVVWEIIVKIVEQTKLDHHS